VGWGDPVRQTSTDPSPSKCLKWAASAIHVDFDIDQRLGELIRPQLEIASKRANDRRFPVANYPTKWLHHERTRMRERIGSIIPFYLLTFRDEMIRYRCIKHVYILLVGLHVSVCLLVIGWKGGVRRKQGSAYPA
jgi:hypothetical protein